MIRVALAGYAGKMGGAVQEAVKKASDMQLVCGIDPHLNEASFPRYAGIEQALEHECFSVLVDFTQPSVVAHNVDAALRAGVNCVVGTTGLTPDQLEALASQAVDEACLFYAPNFTTGAVLMMQFAQAAAPYFPDAEIIEFHHAHKKDAPSGTAIRTAELISEGRGHKQSAAPGKETEVEQGKGARGALVAGIPVHAVRSDGYVASQEVLFGSLGQTLTLRHDSWDRASYMPGVLLGIRKVEQNKGLIVGLENFLSV